MIGKMVQFFRVITYKKTTKKRVQYYRFSIFRQTGNHFTPDNTKYDLVLLDKVSRTIKFKEREKGKWLTKFIEVG